MKHSIKFIVITLLFSSSILNLNSQTSLDKIDLTIGNIPKIQLKIEVKIDEEHSYWKTDKSPTISYKLKNNFESFALDLDANQKKIHTTFNQDVVYLKLRYNPLKSKFFIVTRGDEAYIEYIDGEPFMTITNRKRKTYDENIMEVLTKNGLPLEPIDFYHMKNRPRTKQEKEDAVNDYDIAIRYLDSLSKNNLLSDAEYDYHKKEIFYKRELQTETFNIDLLKAPDLHIKNFELYIRQYVFSNLKKKIISLGNGAARNSLEAFDFAYVSNNFSEKNKTHLLSKYLKNIKIDFPSTTYQNRLQKFQSLISNTDSSLINNDNTLEISSKIRLASKDVVLTDSQYNSTTLKGILDENKGNVIYIDFWASWCAPCRKAFPSYHNLKQEYRGKNVKFFFISGDEDETKWREAENIHGLSNSYLATNYPQAIFYRDLNLSSFPRYLIFDTSGNLVRDRAPGPDSDNIRSLIDELLK